MAPNLFRIVKRKKSLVSEVVSWSNSQVTIDLNFYADVEYHFMEEVVTIHNCVSAHPLNSSVEDVLIWLGTTEDEGFSVAKSYRKLIEPMVREFPSSAVWRRKIPMKILFFAWSAARNRITTNDYLIKCGNFFVNRCPICKCSLVTMCALVNSLQFCLGGLVFVLSQFQVPLGNAKISFGALISMESGGS